jgi:DNA-binding transcriptional ArsR family regulator
MSLFATSSRLRLLWELLGGERSVEELALATDMSQSAVSQQLRLLRQGHLVSVRRLGRQAFYSLHDHHLPELLAALRRHLEHVNGQPRAQVDGARLEPTNSDRER